MCGIIWVKKLDRRHARRLVVRLYDKQAARGQEGFGFVAFEGGKTTKFVKSEHAGAIMGELRKQEADEILFHHRNPTSTPNMLEAAHPLLITPKDSPWKWYVVHNGSIWGQEALREKHLKEGFEYRTELTKCYRSKEGRILEAGIEFNDSESFAIELVKDLEGAKKGLISLSGKIAFVAVQVDAKTRMAVKTYWGKNNGSPLYLERTPHHLAITSVGTGTEILDHRLGCYNYELDDITYTDYNCGYASTYSKEDYYKNRQWDSETKSWIPKATVLALPHAPVGFDKTPQSQESKIEQDLDIITKMNDKLYKARKFLGNLPATDPRRKYVSAQITKIVGELAIFKEKAQKSLIE